MTTTNSINVISQSVKDIPSLKKYIFNRNLPFYISAYSISLTTKIQRNPGVGVITATIHSDEILEDNNQTSFIKKTSITRSCSDCEIKIVAYVGSQNFKPELEVSPKDQTSLLKFCYQFVEENLEFYLTNLNELKDLQFSTDEEYRKNVFFEDNHQKNENLSPKQLSVLYWSARGKTSIEIAEIMHLSNETVKCHKKQILLRLCAANIAHAIYIALQEKILH